MKTPQPAFRSSKERPRAERGHVEQQPSDSQGHCKPVRHIALAEPMISDQKIENLGVTEQRIDRLTGARWRQRRVFSFRRLRSRSPRDVIRRSTLVTSTSQRLDKAPNHNSAIAIAGIEAPEVAAMPSVQLNHMIDTARFRRRVESNFRQMFQIPMIDFSVRGTSLDSCAHVFGLFTVFSLISSFCFLVDSSR
jgi:hypothetical protein